MVYDAIWVMVIHPTGNPYEGIDDHPSSAETHSMKSQVFSPPIGSMVLLYVVTFTINIPPMLVYIPYMDPMGHALI